MPRGRFYDLKEIFDRLMPGPNQLERKREDVKVKPTDLLNFAPMTPITEQGLRTNIDVSLQYIGSWLAGNGCVPINNLMEDAATAEISRSQIWQWIRNVKGTLDDGRKVTLEMFRTLLAEELKRLEGERGAAQLRYEEAAWLLDRLVSADEFVEFLTEPAYELVSSVMVKEEPVAA